MRLKVISCLLLLSFCLSTTATPDSVTLRPLTVVVVDIPIEDVQNELLELSEVFTTYVDSSWKNWKRDIYFCDDLKNMVTRLKVPTLLVMNSTTCDHTQSTYPSSVVLMKLEKRNKLYGHEVAFSEASKTMDSLPDFQPKTFEIYDENTSDLSNVDMPWWILISLVLFLFISAILVGVFCYGKRHSSEDKKEVNKYLSSKSSHARHSTSVKVTDETSRKHMTSSEKSSKSAESSKKSKKSKKTDKSKKSKKSTKNENRSRTSSSSPTKSDKKNKKNKNKKVSSSEKSSRKEGSKESTSKSQKTTNPAKKPLQLVKRSDREAPMSSAEMEAVLRSDRLSKEKTEPPPPPKRTMENMIQEPITSTEFLYYMDKLSKICTDYVEDPSNYPVTCAGEPGFIYKRLSRQAPQEPDNFDSLCYDLKTIIMEGMTHWQHPRWHGYFPAGRNYAIMLAEVLIAGLGVVGFSWDSCPAMTEMEQAIINWMGNALGLPEHLMFTEGVLPEESIGGGCILESSSDAVHNVLIAARMAKIKETLNNNSVDKTKVRNNFDIEEMHELAKRFVVYTSKEAHSCIEKGSKVAMLRCRSVKGNPQNHYVLTGDVLLKEMQKDIERGYIPIYIHATLGTTNQAQSDDILSIWPIAHSHNMWLHVDAAYAAAAWIVPKYRSNRKGLEHISSLSFSAHKMMQHTAGQCFLFVKDQKVYKNAFAMSPVYLKAENKNSSDLRDWSVSLSHRFMCIRTWFLMRLYGLKGLQAYIERLCEMAVYFESLVAAHPNCRMYGKRVFTLFTFQYAKPGMTPQQVNETTTLLCKFMNKSHRIYFSDTNIHGTDVIRVCVNMERVTKAHIDESWSTMQDLMTEFDTDIRRYGDISLSQSIQHVAHVRGSENEHTDRTEKSADDKSSRSSSISKELQKQGFTSITPTTVSSPQNDKKTTGPSTPTTDTEKSTKSTVDETNLKEVKKSDKKEDKQM